MALPYITRTESSISEGLDQMVGDGLPPGWREWTATWAAEKFHIHEIHLFGSRAKGVFDQNSDVDLAYVLLFDDPAEALSYSMFDAAGWEAELEALIGASVQLHLAEPGRDIIVWPAVQEHGQLIYRKEGYLPVR